MTRVYLLGGNMQYLKDLGLTKRQVEQVGKIWNPLVREVGVFAHLAQTAGALTGTLG